MGSGGPAPANHFDRLAGMAAAFLHLHTACRKRGTAVPSRCSPPAARRRPRGTRAVLAMPLWILCPTDVYK